MPVLVWFLFGLLAGMFLPKAALLILAAAAIAYAFAALWRYKRDAGPAWYMPTLGFGFDALYHALLAVALLVGIFLGGFILVAGQHLR